jgi:hypothetical protein
MRTVPVLLLIAALPLSAADPKGGAPAQKEERNAPEGYQQERLQHLLKWAESRGPVKVVECRALKEVAVVIVNDAEPAQKKPDYDPMYFRKDGNQWKFIDDDVFKGKRPVPSISDASRKEFAQLKKWFDARETELKKGGSQPKQPGPTSQGER